MVGAEGLTAEPEAIALLARHANGSWRDENIHIFTQDPGVRAASRQYLSIAAPMYAFIGLSISMYFSSQGAAKVLGPVLAQTARLALVAGGGWWLSAHDASPGNFFTLAASSMVVLGLLSAASVVLTRWGPRSVAVTKVRPALSGMD